MRIPKELPEEMKFYIYECEDNHYIPSIQEFEEAFEHHPEIDWWAETLSLPLEREELQGEAWESPQSYHSHMKERGLSNHDFY